MKIIFKDLKAGRVKLKVENLNDLWYLNRIIAKGDAVKGKIERKINLSDKEHKSSIKKVVATLDIEVDKKEFAQSNLRLSGKTVQETKIIPKDVYQSMNVEIGSVIEIRKKRWLPSDLHYLRESVKPKEDILTVVFDREDAVFAMINDYGFKILSRFTQEVEKKDYKTKNNRNIYEEIIKTLRDYDNRFKVKSIIIASPNFWKDEVMKRLPNDLKKKSVSATASYVGVNGLRELLKRDELKHALANIRSASEEKLIADFMKAVGDSKAEYGLEAVKKADEVGAIDLLLVTDRMLKEEEVEKLMVNIEKKKGRIEIINSESPAGKQLEGLGGIGCILRFNLN